MHFQPCNECVQLFTTAVHFIIVEYFLIANFINGLFANTSFVGVFSALLGAFVGSVTGYYFNARLEKQRSKERYWIQRKNTIYSPIYKMLLALMEYLQSVASTTHPFIQIEYERDYERYDIFNFSLWEAIKKDVRYDYIPENLKDTLADLHKKLRLQEYLQEMLMLRWNDITKDFLKSHKDIFDEEKTKPSSLSERLAREAQSQLFPANSNRENAMMSLLHSYVKEDRKKDLNLIIKNLEKKLKAVREYNELRPSLTKTIRATEYAVNDYRKLITQIITAYEGGVKFE